MILNFEKRMIASVIYFSSDTNIEINSKEKYNENAQTKRKLFRSTIKVYERRSRRGKRGRSDGVKNKGRRKRTAFYTPGV